MANPIPDSEHEQVLTLHRGIADRWAGPGSLNSAAIERDTAFRGVDRMLAGLPGLASLNGSFGADAWDLANFLTVEGRFSRSLSADVRAMSVGEIADLVQLILEEEELQQLESSLELSRGQATTAAKANATRRPAPAGLRRKIASVRRTLAQVRAQLRQPEPAAQDAALVSSQTIDSEAIAAPEVAASGASGSAPLAQVGTEGPIVLGLAQTLRAYARTGPAKAAASPISAASRAVLGRGGSWSPQASGVGVGFQSTVTRALHMAESAADMAMIEPSVEGAWRSPDAIAEATTGRAAAGVPAPVARAGTAPSAIRHPGGALELAHQTGQATERVQRLIAAQQLVRQAALSGTAARSPEAQHTGRTAAMALPRLAHTPAGLSVGAPVSAAAGLQAGATSRAPIQALTGAIALAGRHLARHARALEAVSGARTAHQRQAMTGSRPDSRPESRPQADGQTPLGHDAGAPGATDLSAPSAAFKGLSAFNAPTLAADRFAHLLAPELASAGGSLLPRLTDWFSAGDALLGGRAAPSQGYLSTDIGAGDVLRLAEDIAPQVDGAQTPQAATRGARPAAAVVQPRGAERAAAAPPAWLAPAAARAVQLSAQPRPLAGAPAVATAQPIEAFDASTADTIAAPPASAFAAAGGWSAPPAWPSEVAPGLTGGAGLSAIGLSQRLAARHLAGIDPVVQAPAWQPLAAQSAASRLIGMAPVSMAEALGEGAIGISRGETPVFGLPETAFSRLGESPVAGLGGSLGRDIGAGEWLLPGDEGYDQWLADASKRPADAPPLKPQSRTATQRSQRSPQPPQAVVSESVLPEQAARAAPTAAPTAPSPALARAASAAIAHVVERHERASRLATHQPKQDSPTSPLALAGLGTLTNDVLGLTPGGIGDAITPWLLQGALARLPAETRRAMRIAGLGSGTFLELGDDAIAPRPTAVEGDASPAASASATATGAPAIAAIAGTPAAAGVGELGSVASVRNAIGRSAERQRAAIERAIGRPDVQRQLRRLGSGALDVRQPAALRAAMALFGEAGAGAVETEVTRSFLERWFGGAETGRPQLAAAGAGDLVSLPGESPRAALRTAVDRSMTAMATESPGADGGDEAGGQELVVSGLAGLNAIRNMRGAGDVDAELLSVGEVSETPSTQGAAAAITGAADRRSGAVKLHDFAPVALGRGRSLLGRGRRVRQPGLVRGSRQARFGGRRFGYGQAGLGGGPLVGLMAGDGGDRFHGDDFGSTHMTARAERLSASVEARREAASGPVGRTLRGSQGAQQRVAVDRGQRAAQPGLPRDFNFGETNAELVSPGAAMEQAARGATARQGGTDQARSMKAGAMARVLSVTAAPTANMLPLVAPAARAIASLAAAKSLDESVITSGSDPSAGMPIDRQTGGGSQDQGEASTDEQSGELGKEINALAQRVARSVMVRIKRERERRGIHG